MTVGDKMNDNVKNFNSKEHQKRIDDLSYDMLIQNIDKYSRLGYNFYSVRKFDSCLKIKDLKSRLIKDKLFPFFTKDNDVPLIIFYNMEEHDEYEKEYKKAKLYFNIFIYSTLGSIFLLFLYFSFK